MYMVVRPGVFVNIAKQLEMFRSRGIALNAGFQFKEADYTTRLVVGPGLTGSANDLTVRVGPSQASRIYVGYGATELDVAVRHMKLSPGDEIAVLFTRSTDKDDGIPTRVCRLSTSDSEIYEAVAERLDYQWLDFADMPGRVFVGEKSWSGAGIWF